MEITCSVCGRPVKQPKRGYRLYHPECRSLHDDLERLRKHLARIEDGTHPAALSPKVLAELRFELFTFASAIPRQRDKLGRYVASGVSSEYERERDGRRERKAATG